MHLRYLISILFLFTMIGLGEISISSEDEIDHRGTFAKPVVRTAPRYPGAELRRGNQGWVRLSYVVSPEGEIVDAVVKDSSGGRAFERAALRTVEDWRYEPATWDGEAIQQCDTDVMITFAIEGADVGVRRVFLRKYRRADDALDDGDMERVVEIIDDIADDPLVASERAYLSLLRARYAGQIGDLVAQRRALIRAVAGNGRWIDEQSYPRLLYRLVLIELKSGLFSSALGHWEKLQQLNTDDIDLTAGTTAIANVREAVAGPDILSVDATIESGCDDCTADWHYKPLRNSFSIANVEGSLDNLEIRCQWRRVVDDAGEDKMWNIPDSWGSCHILVFGEDGTTFELLELPDSPVSEAG